MSERPDNTEPTSSRKLPGATGRAVKADVPQVTHKDYLSLAGFLEGRDGSQRVLKKERHSESVRSTGELYEKREYVAAYECFKPVYDKIIADMQRVLARNAEFEANKLAQQSGKPLAIAKENVQQMKAHAQQVIDQFDRVLADLERRPLVRAYLKKSMHEIAAPSPSAAEPPPTTVNSANETRLAANSATPHEVVSGDRRYEKTLYAPPEIGTMYSVRDKDGSDRVIRVVGKSPEGSAVEAEVLKNGKPSQRRIQLSVDSLARQAAKGWCNLLRPLAEEEASTASSQLAAASTEANATLRLDSQNFGRCCGDIARAKIKFSTQLIKDVGDGPFRAGDYEQAFHTFEQLAVGFNSAVASGRRAIADGRRALTAEKGNLSGKEIQERTAAFVRGEQLIHTAEREFSTILEGLRMYLRARQG